MSGGTGPMVWERVCSISHSEGALLLAGKVREHFNMPAAIEVTSEELWLMVRPGRSTTEGVRTQIASYAHGLQDGLQAG